VLACDSWRTSGSAARPSSKGSDSTCNARPSGHWAKTHGHRISTEHVDAGVSGATDAVDRPGLSDALDRIRRPPRAEGIIAARLDRLARALTVQGVPVVSKKFWSDMPVSCGDAVAAAGL
jgi:DNA invertase Pin-like site-specific DNA recombinase